MPIDFARLNAMSPEEREQQSRERNERAWKADEVVRDGRCKKAVSITLTQEPEFRTKPSGERIMLLHGTEAGRTTPLLAVYETPMRVTENAEVQDRFDRKVGALGGGDVVSLAGQWSKRQWKDQAGAAKESWEFKTQHFASGTLPMDRVIEASRREFGEGALAPAMASEPSPVLAPVQSPARARIAMNTGRDR